MTTLLGIVQKLPPQIVASRARLQLTIAWANLLLQRQGPMQAAVNRFEASMTNADLEETTRADLKAEADVLQAVAETHADRTENVEGLVAEAMSRPDTLHPQVPGVAGNIAAFAAIYRFDFDTAHRLLDWASPYNEMMGPFSAVYGRCYGGIADRYRLDIPAALTNFRDAFEIAGGLGPHSHAVRLAGALLANFSTRPATWPRPPPAGGELSVRSEGGGVDYLAARFVIGARIRALHGDRSAAIERLDAGMDAAQRLRLPRLAAAVNNERIRLGIPIAPVAAAACARPAPFRTTME